MTDNGKMDIPGSIPFFVLKGVPGVLPAGTPFAQFLPCKREHWTADQIQPNNDGIKARNRRWDGGVYMKDYRERGRYR